MIDDTREPNGETDHGDDANFTAEVLQLVQLRTDRNDAYTWSKNLKLLALDDHDGPVAELPTHHPRSRDRPSWLCDRCGTGDSSERHHCVVCNNGNYDLCSLCRELGCLDSSHTLYPVEPTFSHARSCASCIALPPFQQRTNSFRIVQQSSLPASPSGECTHFVAVSYCWPQQIEDQSQGRYTVRDINGTVRPNRAPEKILDRAVAFAREAGFRFIWIDQVWPSLSCSSLPGPNR